MDHLHSMKERAFGTGNGEWRKEIRDERRGEVRMCDGICEGLPDNSMC